MSPGGSAIRLLLNAYRRAGCSRAAAAIATVLTSLFLAACGGNTHGPGGASRSLSSAAVTSVTPTAASAAPITIIVRSPAFAAGAPIPARFTCKGSNTAPPLTWSGLPADAVSIALVVDDPDAPGGTYTHWVVFNLPSMTTGIVGGRIPAGAAQARNSGGQRAYMGPCPPSGTHHYRFTIYAEQRRLELPDGVAVREALDAIKTNAIAFGRLTGLFSSG